MPQTQFFALRDDLISLLEAAESKGELKYAETGAFQSPRYEQYWRGAEIPNLGIANYPSASSCRSYLVSDRDLTFNLRNRKLSDGSDQFFMDQLMNPDTIVFSPGGMWEGRLILYGEVGTASCSQVSKRLMQRFRSAIKKHFSKVKAYYVGPNALGLLKGGMRLTMAEQSPNEFDLTLPQ